MLYLVEYVSYVGKSVKPFSAVDVWDLREKLWPLVARVDYFG